MQTDDIPAVAETHVAAWQAAEAGREGPRVDRLVFEDLETLLGALTSPRWHLIQVLREAGPSRVPELARALDRDRDSVHDDVHRLEHLGLVSRTTEGRVAVPWMTVMGELSFPG